MREVGQAWYLFEGNSHDMDFVRIRAAMNVNALSRLAVYFGRLVLEFGALSLYQMKSTFEHTKYIPALRKTFLLSETCLRFFFLL